MAKGSLRVNGIIVDADGEIKASTGDSIVIREDDGSAVITVDTSGNVGINTTAPGAQFDIRGPAGTGSASASVLRMSTAETSVVDTDQLGRIEFIAPLEAGGTDAILVGASIHAEADATFAADNNSTDLVFATGASEAAAEKLRITSGGNLGIGLSPSSTVADGDNLKGLSIGRNTANGEFSYLQLLNRVENATTSNYIHVDFDHKVSGTTTIPLARISARPVSSTAGELSFSTSSSSSLSNAMTITSAGRVGIGSTTPGFQLDLQNGGGDGIRVAGFSTTAGDAGRLYLAHSNNGTAGSQTAVDAEDILGQIIFQGSNGSAFVSGATIKAVADETFSGTAQGSYLSFFTVDNTTTTEDERMRIDHNGNIGIGVSNPSVKFDVFSVDEVAACFSRGADTSTYVTIRTAETQNHVAGWYHTVGASAVTGVGSTNSVTGMISKVMNSSGALQGQLEFHTNDGDSLTQKMTITENGNVGIGNSSPETSLHVGATSPTGSIGATGRPLIVASTLATVYDGTSSATWQGLKTSNSDGTSNRTATGISFEHRTASSGIAAIVSTSAAADRADIRFITRGSSGIGERVVISDAGFVGINTSSPNGLLHVHGALISTSGLNNHQTSGIAVHQTNSTTSEIRCYGPDASTPGTFQLRGYATDGAPFYTAIEVTNSGNVTIPNNHTISGTKSFKIDHPLESKNNSHHLFHSTIEGPKADLIYRGKVTLVNGEATVNIDTISNMTEGTFIALNTDTQCFTTNETGWDLVKGSLSGNILTITSQDNTSTDTISWMVVGERQDQNILNSNMTDSDGKLIVERLKTEWQ
tara:strand:- start:78 stop:2522 length:2445 start_codon:yes stop_codon:yes gene_type:complete